MTRAFLGHTGRTLAADSWTTGLYALVAATAASRVAASILADVTVSLLWVSGILWCVAFGFFAVHYGRMLAFR